MYFFWTFLRNVKITENSLPPVIFTDFCFVTPGSVLEPNCAEIIHIIAGEKLKAVIEQTNINHVHITTSAQISIFLSQ